MNNFFKKKGGSIDYIFEDYYRDDEKQYNKIRSILWHYFNENHPIRAKKYGVIIEYDWRETFFFRKVSTKAYRSMLDLNGEKELKKLKKKLSKDGMLVELAFKGNQPNVSDYTSHEVGRVYSLKVLYNNEEKTIDVLNNLIEEIKDNYYIFSKLEDIYGDKKCMTL